MHACLELHRFVSLTQNGCERIVVAAEKRNSPVCSTTRFFSVSPTLSASSYLCLENTALEVHTSNIMYAQEPRLQLGDEADGFIRF